LEGRKLTVDVRTSIQKVLPLEGLWKKLFSLRGVKLGRQYLNLIGCIFEVHLYAAF